MINWNEVTVGETEIARPGCIKKLIIGVFGDYIWVYDGGGNYDTYHKDVLKDWTIYDPWEEITDQCVWYKDNNSKFDWEIWHQNKRVPHENSIFKTDGRRVWKRKEG